MKIAKQEPDYFTDKFVPYSESKAPMTYFEWFISLPKNKQFAVLKMAKQLNRMGVFSTITEGIEFLHVQITRNR